MNNVYNNNKFIMNINYSINNKLLLDNLMYNYKQKRSK